MSDRSQRLLEVGRIVSPHALNGEVYVVLTSDRHERHSPGAVFETRRGVLTLAAARPHKNGYLMRFREIADRTTAEEFRNIVLSAYGIEDDDAWWIDEMIGAVVVDDQGVERGTVVEIQSNPASDLLVLSSGALVPLRFVDRHHDKVLYVTVPAGLFELYESDEN